MADNPKKNAEGYNDPTPYELAMSIGALFLADDAAKSRRTPHAPSQSRTEKNQ